MIEFGSAVLSSVRYSRMPVDFKHSASNGSIFFYFPLRQEQFRICFLHNAGTRMEGCQRSRFVRSLACKSTLSSLKWIFILLVPHGVIVNVSDRLQILWFMLLACRHSRCSVPSRAGCLRIAHGIGLPSKGAGARRHGRTSTVLQEEDNQDDVNSTLPVHTLLHTRRGLASSDKWSRILVVYPSWYASSRS